MKYIRTLRQVPTKKDLRHALEKFREQEGIEWVSYLERYKLHLRGTTNKVDFLEEVLRQVKFGYRPSCVLGGNTIVRFLEPYARALMELNMTESSLEDLLSNRVINKMEIITKVCPFQNLYVHV